MKEGLKKVATCFKTNKISLNISKTKHLFNSTRKRIDRFNSTRKRIDRPNILSPLHIDNVSVKRELVKKILGVYQDENLS